MKKYCLVMIIAILTTLFALADESRFINALKNCSSYTESGNVYTEGMSVVSTKQILGWDDNRCVYQEKINFSGIDSCIICKFNKTQINEITSVMQAYNLVQKYSEEKIDTSNLSEAQNNPIVKVWNKYLQDSSTCTIKTNMLQPQ